MVDVVLRLKRHRGKCVEYCGKKYTLLGARYKKVGTEEVFGKTVDVVEAVAEILLMGSNSIKYVPAEELKISCAKYDFENKTWYDPTEQLALEA